MNAKSKPPKRGTRTSAFGSPGRVSHDAAAFYGSRLYTGLQPENAADYQEDPVAP